MAGRRGDWYSGSKDRYPPDKVGPNEGLTPSFRPANRYEQNPSQLSGLKHSSSYAPSPEQHYGKRSRLDDIAGYSGTAHYREKTSSLSQGRQQDNDSGDYDKRHDNSHLHNHQSTLANINPNLDKSIYLKFEDKSVGDLLYSRNYVPHRVPGDFVRRVNYSQEKDLDLKVCGRFPKDDLNLHKIYEINKFSHGLQSESKADETLFSRVAIPKMSDVDHTSVIENYLSPSSEFQQRNDYDKIHPRESFEWYSRTRVNNELPSKGGIDKPPREIDYNRNSKSDNDPLSKSRLGVLSRDNNRLPRDDFRTPQVDDFHTDLRSDYVRQIRDDFDRLPKRDMYDKLPPGQVVVNKTDGDHERSKIYGEPTDCSQGFTSKLEPKLLVHDLYKSCVKHPEYIRNPGYKGAVRGVTDISKDVPPPLLGKDVGHPNFPVSKLLDDSNIPPLLPFLGKGVGNPSCPISEPLDDFKRLPIPPLMGKEISNPNFPASESLDDFKRLGDNYAQMKNTSLLDNRRSSLRDEYSKHDFKGNDCESSKDFGHREKNDMKIAKTMHLSKGCNTVPSRNYYEAVRACVAPEKFANNRVDNYDKSQKFSEAEGFIIGEEINTRIRSFSSTVESFSKDNIISNRNNFVQRREDFEKIDFELRKDDSFPTRDEFSRKGEFIPRRNDLGRKDDDITKKDDLVRRDDFGRKDYLISKRDDFRRNNDLNLKRDDFGRKEDVIMRRYDFGRKEDPIPRRDDFGRKDDFIPKRDDIRRNDDLNPRRDDFERKEDLIPRRDDFGRNNDLNPRRVDFGGKEDLIPRRDDFGRKDNLNPRRDDFRKEDLVLRRDDFGRKEDLILRRDNFERKEDIMPRGDFKRKDDLIPKGDDFGRKDDLTPKRDDFRRKDDCERTDDLFPRRDNFVRMEDFILRRDGFERKDALIPRRADCGSKEDFISRRDDFDEGQLHLRRNDFKRPDNFTPRRDGFESQDNLIARDDFDRKEYYEMLRRYGDSETFIPPLDAPGDLHDTPMTYPEMQGGRKFMQDDLISRKIFSGREYFRCKQDYFDRQMVDANIDDRSISGVIDSLPRDYPDYDTYRDTVTVDLRFDQDRGSFYDRPALEDKRRAYVSYRDSFTHDNRGVGDNSLSRPSNDRFRPDNTGQLNFNNKSGNRDSFGFKQSFRDKLDLSSNKKDLVNKQPEHKIDEKEANKTEILKNEEKEGNNLLNKSDSNSANKKLTSDTVVKKEQKENTSFSPDNEMLTVEKIKNTTGPCGINMVVVAKLYDNAIGTLEKMHAMMKKKFEIKFTFNDEASKWVATVWLNNDVIETDSASIKDVAKKAAAKKAVEKLQQHYYTVLIKADYYGGGKCVESSGKLLTGVKLRPSQAKFRYVLVPDMKKVKKAIDDYVNSELVHDLVIGFTTTPEYRKELQTYATSAHGLLVRKFGPQNSRFFVLSKRIDIWRIVQGLIDKDVRFLANHQLLPPNMKKDDTCH